MIHWPRTRTVLFGYSLLAALGLIFLSTRFYFGGPRRLMLAAGILALAGAFTFLANRIVRDPSYAVRLKDFLGGTETRRRRESCLLLVLLLGAAFAAALPGYRLTWVSGYYWQALQPVFLAVVLLAAGALIAHGILFAGEGGGGPWRLEPYLQPAALVLAGFLALWLVMRLTGLGLERREDYWYGAGVPALPLQVLGALALGWLAARWRGARTGRGLDVLLFFLAWAVTGFLWAREPLRASFFMPGPFRPTGDFYPFSDGLLFDVGGQFALIGQGVMNGLVFDRVLYMAFSAYLHALAGQGFVTVMAVQAAVYAVLAGILYLLGRELGGVGLGVSLAVLTALRGVNSIAAASWIDLANPKMTLTDFPTAIGAALFTLFMVRWLKEPAARRGAAVLAGGILGLTLMLRVHVLLLLLPALLLAWAVTRFNWRRWLPGFLLLVVGMLAATTPWDLRNQSKGAPAFDLYFHSLRVVLQARYGWPPAMTPVPESRSTGGLALAAPETGLPPCEDLLCKVTNHLLHNAVTSVLYLPASPVLDDLRTTVKTALPFWSQGWQGEGVRPVSLGMVLLNLVLIALGLGLAWRRGRWVALTPLFILLTYLLSNALAQTSGGRYLVPVDWVVGLYYLWGVLALLGAESSGQAIIETGPEEVIPSPPGKPVRRFTDRGGIAWSLLLVLLVGTSVPLSEKLFPLRYAGQPELTAVLARFDSTPGLEKSGLDLAALQGFLEQPGAGVWTGRMLYPRFYAIGKGETALDVPYNIQPYPRMAFTLIGPAGQTGVVLPGKVQGRFASGADVLVVGCYTPLRGGVQTGTIDALVVMLPGQAVSVRGPLSDLECPLRAPVCTDHETCY